MEEANENQQLVLSGEADIFSDLEKTVILLAARSGWECAGTVGSRLARTGSQLLQIVVPDAIPRPLANTRLEALRVLACASFSTGGMPAKSVVAAAREAGISSVQVTELARIGRT